MVINTLALEGLTEIADSASTRELFQFWFLSAVLMEYTSSRRETRLVSNGRLRPCLLCSYVKYKIHKQQSNIEELLIKGGKIVNEKGLGQTYMPTSSHVHIICMVKGSHFLKKKITPHEIF